eukprot:CAMPEP_0184706204 /NCGR_PEP_ID=MMETSP0313-20130426/36639_1 /TAXON_ID=2792 /ORGANISM="Porphyridium aerugineum, Strain SAG 1380-2" /LENGTH=483 /DNA_ID=CAMNT_0027167751 /DNA_START=248 /DNA_END=1700 /DNA_ORIENTATION=-
MAKVGEGDSRWIVEEREDGRNVNNWHWSERNVSKWAYERVKQLLSQIQIIDAYDADRKVKCTISSVDKVEGDAVLYNRKGKLKTVHDLKVSGKWKAQILDRDGNPIAPPPAPKEEPKEGKLKTVHDLKVSGKWKAQILDRDGNPIAPPPAPKEEPKEEPKDNENDKEKEKELQKEKEKEREKERENASKEKTVVLGDFSFELYDAEPDVTFTTSSNTPLASKCRTLLRSRGVSAVHEIAAKFMADLTAGGDIDIKSLQKLPSANLAAEAKAATSSSSLPMPKLQASAAPAPDTGASDAQPPAVKRKSHPTSSSESVSGPSKTTLCITEFFRTTPMDLYLALMDSRRVSGYTMKKADISDQVGGAFSIKNGYITGTNVELVPGKRIVQKWRMAKYEPDDLYTDVVISIAENEGQTEMNLIQSGIPESLRHETEVEWRVETFERMRMVLGYGSGGCSSRWFVEIELAASEKFIGIRLHVCESGLD